MMVCPCVRLCVGFFRNDLTLSVLESRVNIGGKSRDRKDEIR